MRIEDLEQLLTYLEDKIRKIRQDLHNSKSSRVDNIFIQQIIALFDKITEALGIDSGLEEKRRIYGNIVDFLKEKGGKRGAECAYLSAAHRLCNETDSRLTYANDDSQSVIEITDWARETIIAVKVCYDKKSGDMVAFRTEIFSKGIGDLQLIRSKWECIGNWDDLPPKVREEFIRSDEKSLDYPWYPNQDKNLK
jgi:hypothetical protein